MINIHDHKPEHHVRDRLTLLYTPREKVEAHAAVEATQDAPAKPAVKGRDADPDELELPKLRAGQDTQGKTRFVQHKLKKGKNPGIPTSYFHAIGGEPAINELIATGVIKPVCEEHVFDDGQPACRYCGTPNPLF